MVSALHLRIVILIVPPFSLQDGLTQKALALYVQYDTPAFPQNYNIYRRIALDLFSMSGLDEINAYIVWKQLRSMLFSLVSTSGHIFLYRNRTLSS